MLRALILVSGIQIIASWGWSADLKPDAGTEIPASAKRPVVLTADSSQISKQKAQVPKALLPEGLELSIAAAAPLVTHPIMGCLDDRGRLFLGDATGVNWNKAQLEANPPNRVLMLEDRDRDGIFDKSTIFADKMTFPQGACWLNGSLYVCSPPGLWKLTDTDDDGVADQRDMIVGGFEHTGNAADVHGPFLHPNGRLYWCHGRKGHKVVQKDGTMVHEGLASGIWSCKPDGNDIQWHALGCGDNPVEVDFTPEGDIIGTQNLHYSQPRGDTIVHWLYGGVYERPDQLKAIEGLPRTLEHMPVMYNFGHVAVSGCCFAKSGLLFSEGSAGGPLQFLVTHFNTQRVARMELTRDGATYKATEHEFLRLTESPDVHFTDVMEDADGSILVVDTGGWFRIGCPSSLMAKPDVAGAVYRVRKKGMPARAELARDGKPDPWGEDIIWGSRTSSQLLRLLDDDRWFVRTKATQSLGENGNERTLSKVRDYFRDDTFKSERAGLAAVWALRQMAEHYQHLYDNPIAVLSSLSGYATRGVIASNQQERKFLLPPTILRGAFNAVASLDADQLYRGTASLSQFEPDAGSGLLSPILQAIARSDRISSDEDDLLKVFQNPDLGPVAEHYIMLVFNRHKELRRPVFNEDRSEIIRYDSTPLAPQLIAILRDAKTHARVKQRLLTVLNNTSDLLQPRDIFEFLSDSDEDLRRNASSLFRNRPTWTPAFANEIKSELVHRDLVNVSLDAWVEVISASIQNPEVQSAVTAMLSKDSKKLTTAAWAALSAQTAGVTNEAWLPLLQKALDEAEPADLPLLLDALKKLKTDRFNPKLQAIADDATRPLPLRLKALDAMKGSKMTPATFAFLQEVLVGVNASAAARIQAAAMLAAAPLDASQTATLASALASVGPVELKDLCTLIRKTKDEALLRTLANELAKNPSLGALQESHYRNAFADKPTDLFENIVLPALRKANEFMESRKRQLPALAEKAAVNGRAEEGRKHFEAGKGSCIACHRVGSMGRPIGPDLSSIGAIRTERDLLESILFPSNTLARDYEAHVIETSDGQTCMGVIKSHTAEGLLVVDVAGQERTVPHDRIVANTTLTTSLMPMGLDGTMSEQELSDMVAWLRSLR